MWQSFPDPEAHPGKATQFKKGNPGRPKNAKPVSERRARKLAKQVIIAEACRNVRDFDGDALQYLQAIYSGQIPADLSSRMSAAIQALKFERPALAAQLTATVDPNAALTPEQVNRRFAELLMSFPAAGMGNGLGDRQPPMIEAAPIPQETASVQETAAANYSADAASQPRRRRERQSAP